MLNLALRNHQHAYAVRKLLCAASRAADLLDVSLRELRQKFRRGNRSFIERMGKAGKIQNEAQALPTLGKAAPTPLRGRRTERPTLATTELKWQRTRKYNLEQLVRVDAAAIGVLEDQPAAPW
jgi:hypothetical protein